MEQYLNSNDLRKKLGSISIRTVNRYILKGLLPKPFKVGGRLLWRDDEVDDYIAKQRMEGVQ